MNFTKLEKNLSHVGTLPDTPTLENGYTPKALKATFDRAGEDIKEYINTVLISELENSGAGRIGTDEIETVQGTSIQEKLENIAGQIKDIANASIPEGTLEPEKFVPSAASFLIEGSPRCAYYSEAGEYTFVPTRSGNYKITVQGAGAGGGITYDTKDPCGGGSGATAIGWIRLEKGVEYNIKVGRGGNPITLSDQNKYVSPSENGEASGFYSGEQELLYADGGIRGRNMSSIAMARGGTLNIHGEHPPMSSYTTGTQYYKIGARSYISSHTSSKDVKPGAGAGGYASSDVHNGVYDFPGTAGGDGAVLIEWME